MDMSFQWGWAFPHTQALSVDCEKGRTQPHVTYEPGSRAAD